MGIQPQVITGHIHICRVDPNLAMIHTKDKIHIGSFIRLYGRDVLVRTIKCEDSKYYKGLKFYDINFKDNKK